MEPEVLIVKPAESFLKSDSVRKRFEQQLKYNIKMCLKNNEIEFDHIEHVSPRILVYTDDLEEAAEQIKNIFGISAIHLAIQVGSDFDIVKKSALEEATKAGLTKSKTFAVKVKRVTKDFKINSQEIAEQVGEYIGNLTNAKVKLKNPQILIGIEVYKHKFFIYTKTITGFGGLPVGTAGKVVCLMSDSKESIFAAWLMMKRGCEILPFHLRTSEKEQQTYMNNLQHLNKFAWGFKIKAYRAKMDNIVTQLKDFAVENHCKAIVTEHTTLDNQLTEFHKIIKLPVFSPLIGASKKEIKELNRVIF